MEMDDLQSKEINELILALSKAQGSLESAKKDKTNPFFKSKYADLSSVWDACRRVLSSNGLAIVQATSPSEDGRLMLVTTLGHSSGQWMRSYMPIITQKTDSQSLGSAMTYTKRYSLSAMIGISNGEDDDGEKSMGDRKGTSQTLKAAGLKKENKTSKKVSSIELHEIEQLINGHDDIRERMCKWIKDQFKGEKLSDLPKCEFQNMKKYCRMAVEDKYKKAQEEEVKNERVS